MVAPTPFRYFRYRGKKASGTAFDGSPSWDPRKEGGRLFCFEGSYSVSRQIRLANPTGMAKLRGKRGDAWFLVAGGGGRAVGLAVCLHGFRRRREEGPMSRACGGQSGWARVSLLLTRGRKEPHYTVRDGRSRTSPKRRGGKAAREPSIRRK